VKAEASPPPAVAVVDADPGLGAGDDAVGGVADVGDGGGPRRGGHVAVGAVVAEVLGAQGRGVAVGVVDRGAHRRIRRRGQLVGLVVAGGGGRGPIVADRAAVGVLPRGRGQPAAPGCGGGSGRCARRPGCPRGSWESASARAPSGPAAIRTGASLPRSTRWCASPRHSTSRSTTCWSRTPPAGPCTWPTWAWPPGWPTLPSCRPRTGRRCCTCWMPWCVARSKADTKSGGIRTLVPVESGQSFRLIPDT
jgi:hypothetical protein